MSAGSAHAQIPTRIRGPTLDDLLVDAGRDDAVDVDRLRDVLERLLADALQHERRADASSGDGASGGKGPPLPRPGAERGGADQRLAGVDPRVELDRREDAAVLLV